MMWPDPEDRTIDSLISVLDNIGFTCSSCIHQRKDGWTCDAFPEEGIPANFISGRVRHDKPFPGDHGIQFEAKKNDDK